MPNLIPSSVKLPEKWGNYLVVQLVKEDQKPVEILGFPEAYRLGQELDEFLKDSKVTKFIAVNLGAVEIISDMGGSVLFTFADKFKEIGGKLILVDSLKVKGEGFSFLFHLDKVASLPADGEASVRRENG